MVFLYASVHKSTTNSKYRHTNPAPPAAAVSPPHAPTLANLPHTIPPTSYPQISPHPQLLPPLPEHPSATFFRPSASSHLLFPPYFGVPPASSIPALAETIPDSAGPYEHRTPTCTPCGVLQACVTSQSCFCILFEPRVNITKN